jgi:hypothetical protein
MGDVHLIEVLGTRARRSVLGASVDSVGQGGDRRVEHVLSGRRTRFETLEQLSEFLGEVLRTEKSEKS